MKRYLMPADCPLSNLIVLEWIGVPLPIPTRSSFALGDRQTLPQVTSRTLER